MELTKDNVIASLISLPQQKRKKLVQECTAMAEEQDFHIGGTAIGLFNVPFFVQNSVLEPALARLRVFLDALIRLEVHALKEKGALYERLMKSLTPGGRALVEQCSYESEFSLRRRQRRIDAFIDRTTGACSVIEVNQAAPLAIHYHDVGQRVAAHVMQELGFDYAPDLIAGRLLDWFIDEYRHRYGTDGFPDSIALVIEHGYPPKFVDLPAMAKACERLARERHNHELRIHTAFPYEIKLLNGEIVLGPEKIDMIWRNSVYMTGYREKGIDISDYEKILADPEKYLIINATRSWLTRTKEVFAIVWDDDLMADAGFSIGEVASLRETVPPTVNLFRNGGRKKELLSDRALWMTKPTDSGFGKGVEFGENHDDESWGRLLEERSMDGFVFQRKVACPHAHTTDIDSDGNLVFHHIEYDFCPHVINGEFTFTALVRSSILDGSAANLSTMNLVSGGRLFPMIRL